jgi:hypothetical protein
MAATNRNAGQATAMTHVGRGWARSTSLACTVDRVSRRTNRWEAAGPGRTRHMCFGLQPACHAYVCGTREASTTARRMWPAAKRHTVEHCLGEQHVMTLHALPKVGVWHAFVAFGSPPVAPPHVTPACAHVPAQWRRSHRPWRRYWT